MKVLIKSVFEPQVKSGPTDDEIHQAHLDSIKVIHVEAPNSSLPQEPASAYLSEGLVPVLGLGGLAALSIPLLDGAALQGLSQRDALSLLSLQPFQSGFLLQPEGGAATAAATFPAVKPGEAGGAGVVELADIQQILKVTTAAPSQIPPLAKAPGFTGGHGEFSSVCSFWFWLLADEFCPAPPQVRSRARRLCRR